jgi:uncharacterized phage-associated protein
MNTSTITLEVPESRLRPLVTELKESIKADCGTEYSEEAIRESVIDWLHSRVDGLFEEAVERLTSPSYEDAREFARMLEYGSIQNKAESVESTATSSVFTGNRPFSLEKMAAMVSYLAAKTSDLYKTKLNKLLFYADFVNYHVYGNSISGSRYVHLPYGPVPDGYEDTLETLNHYGVIEVRRQNSADLVLGGDNPARQFLSEAEQSTLDWVIDRFGHMSASQLTEISHREKAYRFTKTGEEIAYEYAKFFEKLPEKRVFSIDRKSC